MHATGMNDKEIGSELGIGATAVYRAWSGTEAKRNAANRIVHKRDYEERTCPIENAQTALMDLLGKGMPDGSVVERVAIESDGQEKTAVIEWLHVKPQLAMTMRVEMIATDLDELRHIARFVLARVS